MLTNGLRGFESIHVGHLDVHQHQVEQLCWQASIASRPLLAIDTRCPRLCSMSLSTVWLMRLSSTSSKSAERGGTSHRLSGTSFD